MILKLIFLLIAVAGLNQHFLDQRKHRMYKNTGQLQYDSLIIHKVDSLLITTYRK